MLTSTAHYKSEAMSLPSTFSYAQAAKGQSSQPAGSQSSPVPSQAALVNGAPNREAAVTSTRASSVAVSTASAEVDASQSTRGTSAMLEASDSTNSDAEPKLVNGDVSTSNTAVEPLDSAKPRDKSLNDNASQSSERRGRAPSSASLAADNGDNKKGRKGKKGKSPEKDAEAEHDDDSKEDPLPKPELHEAPVPTVNPWTQRAQAAKAKTAPSLVSHFRSSSTAAAGSQGGSANHISAETKQKLPVGEGIDSGASHNRSSSTSTKGFKKEGDVLKYGSQGGPRRTGPRGTRAQDKDDKIGFEALSSLTANSASWPTPDTARVTPKAQSLAESQTQAQSNHSAQTQNSADKEDNGPAKPKKWVQMEITPSVKFDTPLPTRGRGGRAGGSRGGRDIGGGGNHHATIVSDRHQDNGPNGRAVPGTKRGSVDTASREPRKYGPAEGSRTTGESSFDKHKADLYKQGQSEMNGGSTTNSFSRAPNFNQRMEDVARFPEPQRDTKMQAAKDSHYQGQNGTSHRASDRGRGGGRGRGGYSNANHPNGLLNHAQGHYVQGAHAYPYPPNMPPQQMAYRYPAMTYSGQVPNPPTSGSRRSGSMGGRSSQGGHGLRNGRGSSMQSMNLPYDFAMYQAPPNPVSYLETNNLYQLARQQVEYYFSLDNLVKDWFLRQRMDSQGFVYLDFIASFNRLRQLQVDHDLLRHACDESNEVEFVVGDDGYERVRRVTGWEQFVIPDMNARHETARHGGPSNWNRWNRALMAQYHQPIMPSPYGMEPSPVFSPTGTESGFSHYMNGNAMPPAMNTTMSNGVNGHIRTTDSQLSAAVPEFSPATASGFAGAQSIAEGNGETTSSMKQKIATSSTGGQEASPLPNGDAHEASAPTENQPGVVNGIHEGHEVNSH
ncbi:hypothetical protein GGR56DRAFT_41686 [Xylariaceae sp. FL0804]|nr:hypothetical protein GGR56DRAFT_41686 [Xylariaceae sp. FL0804]